MAFWTCPGCGRRVPGYATACHCGQARTAATLLPAAPIPDARFTWSQVPWQAWAAIGVVILALGFGAWQIFRGGPHERLVTPFGVFTLEPLDRPSPTPSRRPSAEAK